jgi:hypothetical protein
MRYQQRPQSHSNDETWPREKSAGHSVGGGQAFTIGLRHLDRFAWVAEFSSGVLSDANFRIEEYMPSLIEDAPSLNQRLRLLFLSCGSEDPRYQGQLDLKDALTKYMPLLVGSGDCVRVVGDPETIQPLDGEKNADSITLKG